ncbi:hypothetical protein U8527_05380 [Kordia algicida OT-1]|uniref:Uncharacterized protein n=1 Tax=Kordia algicida OT-1 TaxID=391587 RepID=A9DMP4_9FLAO|nr:hypothetical protein [Kordia algicida]EDP97756.1 hypothetical protein KAOT1_21377 [Kordia algicida OT-1]
MKTTSVSLFLIFVLIFNSCCATKTTTSNTNSTAVETPIVSENPTIERAEDFDGWSTQIDNLNTTQIKIVCKESKLEIRQKILAYLRLNRIFLNDIELRNAIVETSESGRIIIPQNNYRLDFIYKNNEVIVQGDEKDAMGIDPEWDFIKPISSNWGLLSGFSDQLTVEKILYK